MIKCEQVTKVYKDSVAALQDVTLEINKGEFVFIVGPSGSGKSTFIRLMLKEEEPTSGDIYVAGKNIGRLSRWKVPELRRNIGTVFQDFKLLPNRTVFQNVSFALEVIGKPKHIVDQRVPEILELVGLGEKLNNYPDEINRIGTTVIMATHDNAIVDAMRRRVIELDSGKVVRDQSRGVYGYGT